MILPLSTDRPSHRPVLVTPLLIAANVATFVFMLAAERMAPELSTNLDDLLVLRPEQLRWWAFISYAFLHASVPHIGFNMLFLWVFGPPVEDRFGRLGFTAFYLLGAAASGGLHVLFEKAGVIGASGAIAGVTGAFLILFPLTRVRCMFLLSASYTWISATWLIGFAIAIDLLGQTFGGFGALGGGGIARLAHIGGYLYGGSVAFALLAFRILDRENFDVFTMVRQARRRRVLREAMLEAERNVGVRKREPGAGGGGAGLAGLFGGAKGAANAPDQALLDEIAKARAEVSRLAGSGDLPAAAKAYAAFLAQFGGTATVVVSPVDAQPRPQRVAAGSGSAAVPPALTTMSRRLQLDIGNHFFAQNENLLAAAAYERFTAIYPDDREVARIRVLVALICARRLGDKPRGRAALEGISERLSDPAEDALAQELAAELSDAPIPAKPGAGS